MSNWILKQNRLCYPEPDNAGGGAAQGTDAPAPDAPADTSGGQDATPPAPSDGDADPFAGFDYDDTAEDGGEPDTPPDAEQEEDRFTFDGADKDEPTTALLGELCEKHGLGKRDMSPFLDDLIKGVTDIEKKNADAIEKAHTAELRQAWGDKFDANCKQTWAFMQRIAKGAGWTKEQMEGLRHADGFRLFYDVMRAVGGKQQSVGTTRNAVPAATPQQLEDQRTQLVYDYYEALKNDDRAKAKEISNKHMELTYQLTGNRERHLFVYD